MSDLSFCKTNLCEKKLAFGCKEVCFGEKNCLKTNCKHMVDLCQLDIDKKIVQNKSPNFFVKIKFMIVSFGIIFGGGVFCI